jgi:hypothetical protein
MIRIIYIILLALTFLASSCESRNKRPDRNNLIPEKQLVPLLTDVYLTDGLINFPRVSQKYAPLDSSSTYDHIIQEHGYTRADLNRTLKYYFVRNPKKLIAIYDKVLGILSVMESKIQKELLKLRQDAEIIWKGPDSFFYPDPCTADSTNFDLTFKRPGLYTLTETVTLFPDDQSLNPGLAAVSFNPDSAVTGKRYYTRPLHFIKDGYPHTYEITFRVPLRTTLRITGNLYEFDNNPDEWDKHIVIRNVAINYSMLEK